MVTTGSVQLDPIKPALQTLHVSPSQLPVQLHFPFDSWHVPWLPQSTFAHFDGGSWQPNEPPLSTQWVVPVHAAQLVQ